MNIDTDKYTFTNHTYEEYLKIQYNKGEIKAYFNIDEIMSKNIKPETLNANLIDPNGEYLSNFPGIYTKNLKCCENIREVVKLAANIISTFLYDFYKSHTGKELDEYLFKTLHDLDLPYKLHNSERWLIITADSEVLICVYCKRSGDSIKNEQNTILFGQSHICFNNHVFDSVHSLCITSKFDKRYKIFTRDLDGNIIFFNNNFNNFVNNECQSIHIFNIKNANKIVHYPSLDNEVTKKRYVCGFNKAIYVGASRDVYIAAMELLNIGMDEFYKKLDKKYVNIHFNSDEPLYKLIESNFTFLLTYFDHQ